MMTRKVCFLALAGLVSIQPVMAEDAAETSLTTENQKFSYALGMDIGRSLKQLNAKANINIEDFNKGLQDTLKGQKTLLTQKQAQQIKIQF